MKSLRKKLFLSILAVAFAVVSLATSTFAWFSMNTTVTATGMQVQAVVSDNLLISNDTTEANFQGGQITQAQKGILEPVSTIDGKNFFYTVNAKADGDAKENLYTKYGTEAALEGTDATNFDSAFSKAYGVSRTVANAKISGETGAKAYVDYTFYLKAVSSSENQKINMHKCVLKYNGGAPTDTAMRVSVFATTPQTTASAAASAETTLVTILASSTAVNQTADKAIKAVGAADAEDSAVLDTVTNHGVNAVIDNDLDVETSYYKVVVRLYLEGEDKTCTNATFADLTGSWTLDIGFSLTDSAVNVIANS